MMETALTVAASMLGGAGVVELIRWLRYRRTDSAVEKKHLSEAGAATQTSEANWLQVSSKELAIWIKTASDSKMMIIDLTAENKELKHALGLCRETVEQMMKQQKREGH